MPKYDTTKRSSRAKVETSRTVRREVHATGRGLGAPQPTKAEALQVALGLQSFGQALEQRNREQERRQAKADAEKAAAKKAQDELDKRQAKIDHLRGIALDPTRSAAYTAEHNMLSGLSSSRKNIAEALDAFNPAEDRDIESIVSNIYAQTVQGNEGNLEFMEGAAHEMDKFRNDLYKKQQDFDDQVYSEQRTENIQSLTMEAMELMGEKQTPEEQVAVHRKLMSSIKDVYPEMSNKDISKMLVNMYGETAAAGEANFLHVFDAQGSDGTPPLSSHPEFIDDIYKYKEAFEKTKEKTFNMAFSNFDQELRRKAAAGELTDADDAMLLQSGFANKYTPKEWAKLKLQSQQAAINGLKNDVFRKSFANKALFHSSYKDTKEQNTIIDNEFMGQLELVAAGEMTVTEVAKYWQGLTVPKYFTNYLKNSFNVMARGEFDENTRASFQLIREFRAAGLQPLTDPEHRKVFKLYETLSGIGQKSEEAVWTSIQTFLNRNQADYQENLSISANELEESVSDIDLDSGWFSTVNTTVVEQQVKNLASAYLMSSDMSKEQALTAAVEDLKDDYVTINDQAFYVGHKMSPDPDDEDEVYRNFSSKMLELNYDTYKEKFNLDPNLTNEDFYIAPDSHNAGWSYIFNKDSNRVVGRIYTKNQLNSFRLYDSDKEAPNSGLSKARDKMFESIAYNGLAQDFKIEKQKNNWFSEGRDAGDDLNEIQDWFNKRVNKRKAKNKDSLSKFNSL